MKVPQIRIGRFVTLLLVIFLGSFLWAGGDMLLRSVIPKTSLITAPAISSDVKSGWERVYRIAALKSAVNTRINPKTYVRLADIPLTMQQAIIAVEDNRFYQHIGFDVEGILRAVLVNMQTGEVQEGGSTITQQLAKNLFLSQERTLGRKIEEFILAIDMELRYSKEEILEMYLNTIYFGSGAYGIGEASVVYFGKPPFNLTLAESAMLAGLPNSPSVTSPYVDFAAAKQRQAVVLAALARHGYIGPAQAQEAKIEPLKLAK